VRFDQVTVSRRVSCTQFIAELRGARDAELDLLLAIIEHRAGGSLDDESVARAALENLLQDNPAHFGRAADLVTAEHQ
jgi:hypothetical protein